MHVITGDNKQQRIRIPFSHRVVVLPAAANHLGVASTPSYLAYIDQAIEAWFVAALGHGYRERFVPVARSVSVDWCDAVRPGDVIGFAIYVESWNADSVHVRVTGRVAGREVIRATLDYAISRPGEEPGEMPVLVKHALTSALLGL